MTQQGPLPLRLVVKPWQIFYDCEVRRGTNPTEQREEQHFGISCCFSLAGDENWRALLGMPATRRILAWEVEEEKGLE